MRKKIVALLLLLVPAAFAVFLAWEPQSAQAVQYRERQVKWIQTQVPALPDSDVSSRTAAFVAAATVQPIDTTQWIPIWDGMNLNPGAGGVSALLDTNVAVGTFVVYPIPTQLCAGCIPPAVDTITISMQASIDGVNPVAVTLKFNAPWLETSSNNAVYLPITFGRTGIVNGTAPTTALLGPYRFMRFICAGDQVGNMVAYWQYPGPDKP